MIGLILHLSEGKTLSCLKLVKMLSVLTAVKFFMLTEDA